MTIQEIKALPKEFDFKSNINLYGLTYHAKETEHNYIVTHNDSKWEYDKKEFRRNLLNNIFVVIRSGPMDKNQLHQLIEEKVNEMFFEYQDANNITNGDIDPFDTLQLEMIERELANLIERVCAYQKGGN